jgi:hypothetical protein
LVTINAEGVVLNSNSLGVEISALGLDNGIILNSSHGGINIISTGPIMSYPITASLHGTASNSISASWAPSAGGGTTLTTGSTYQITSSNSISASWAPQNNITSVPSSSWASSSISSSYSLTSSYALNGGGSGGGTTLTTGSTYPITSSWALTSSILNYGTLLKSNTLGQLSVQNGGVFPNNTYYSAEFGNAIIITGPYAGFIVTDRSTPSFQWQHYSDANTFRIWNGGFVAPESFVMDSNGKFALGYTSYSPTLVNTLDVYGNISCSVITASLFNGTASYALSSPGSGGGTTLTTGSTYPITSSWALTSSYVNNIIISGIASIRFPLYDVSEENFSSVTVNSPYIYLDKIVSTCILPMTSSNHESLDDFKVENINLNISNIIDGVSFDIILNAPNNTWGMYNVYYKISTTN